MELVNIINIVIGHQIDVYDERVICVGLLLAMKMKI